MRPTNFISALFLVTCPLCAQDHEITFHRPLTVGYRYDFDGTVTDEQSQKIEVNDTSLRDNATKVEGMLKALVEVTGINKDKLAQTMRITVKDWSLKVDNRSSGALKTGDVIEATGGKTSVFSVNGLPVSKEENRILSHMMSLKRADEPDTDDRILGPGHKVKVGDAWPVNAEPAAKELSESFTTEIAPKMVKGLVTLTGIEDGESKNAQQLSAHLSINGPGLAVPGAPAGVKAKTFVVTVDVKTVLPEDVSKQPLSLEEETSSDISGESEVKNDGKSGSMRFVLSMHGVKRCKMKPVH